MWQVLEGIRFLRDRRRVLAVLSADTILFTESGGVRIGKTLGDEGVDDTSDFSLFCSGGRAQLQGQPCGDVRRHVRAVRPGGGSNQANEEKSTAPSVERRDRESAGSIEEQVYRGTPAGQSCLSKSGVHN